MNTLGSATKGYIKELTETMVPGTNTPFVNKKNQEGCRTDLEFDVTKQNTGNTSCTCQRFFGSRVIVTDFPIDFVAVDRW